MVVSTDWRKNFVTIGTRKMYDNHGTYDDHTFYDGQYTTLNTYSTDWVPNAASVPIALSHAGESIGLLLAITRAS